VKTGEMPRPPTMRLDLFLKWSGLVRRRTLAKWLCDHQAIRVNRGVAKAGRLIGLGDRILLPRNHCWIEIEVLHLPLQETFRGEARNSASARAEVYRVVCESHSAVKDLSNPEADPSALGP
jgi:ribosomal 50S subunit-recycling heat shock protein